MILVWLVPWITLHHNIRLISSLPAGFTSSQWPPSHNIYTARQNVPNTQRGGGDRGNGGLQAGTQRDQHAERRSGLHVTTSWGSAPKSHWEDNSGIGWSPERHTKSLVYLGGGNEGEEDANSKVTSQVVEEQEVLNVSDKNSPYALIDKYFPERESYYYQNKDSFQHGWRRGYTPDIGNLSPDEVWMVDDSMLVLKGGSTKSDKVGYEDVWEPLDDYQAPYREPILPPNPNDEESNESIEANKVTVNTVGNYYSYEKQPINTEPNHNSIEQPLIPFQEEISRSTQEEYIPFLNQVIKQMENFQPQKRRAVPVTVSTTPHAPPAARHAPVNENNGGYFYPESREEEQYKQSYGTFFENNNFILNPRSEHKQPPARSYFPQDRDNGGSDTQQPAARNLPYKFIPPLKNNGIGDYSTNTQLPPTLAKAAWWEAPALAALNAPAASLKSEFPSVRSLGGRGIDLNNAKLTDGRLGAIGGQRLNLGGNNQINHPQKLNIISTEPENSSNFSSPLLQPQVDGSRPTGNIQRQVYDGFVPVPGPVTADKYRFNVFPAVPGSNGVEQDGENQKDYSPTVSIPQQLLQQQPALSQPLKPQLSQPPQPYRQQFQDVNLGTEQIKQNERGRLPSISTTPYNPPSYPHSISGGAGGGPAPLTQAYHAVQNGGVTNNRDSRYISFYSGVRSAGSSWGYTYNMK